MTELVDAIVRSLEEEPEKWKMNPRNKGLVEGPGGISLAAEPWFLGFARRTDGGYLPSDLRVRLKVRRAIDRMRAANEITALNGEKP